MRDALLPCRSPARPPLPDPSCCPRSPIPPRLKPVAYLHTAFSYTHTPLSVPRPRVALLSLPPYPPIHSLFPSQPRAHTHILSLSLSHTHTCCRHEATPRRPGLDCRVTLGGEPVFAPRFRHCPRPKQPGLGARRFKRCRPGPVVHVCHPRQPGHLRHYRLVDLPALLLVASWCHVWTADRLLVLHG